MSSAQSSGDIYDETLAVFDDHAHPYEPLTTPEIAAALDCERRTVYKRLKILVDRGELETKKVGSSARVWWRYNAESIPPPNVDHGSARPAETRGEEASATAGEILPIEDVIDTAEIGVFVLDSEFTIAWVDTTVERIFGLDREEVIGEKTHEIIHEQIESKILDSEKFVDTILRTYEDNTEAEEFEFRGMVNADGEERWFEHRSKPIASGRFSGGRVEVYYDITERKLREQKLEQYETIVETVADGVYALDENERYLMVNDAFCEITGYDRDELLGAHPTRIYDPAVSNIVNQYGEQMSTGELASGTHDFDLERADGTLVSVESQFTLYGSTENSKTRCGVVRDITERKKRERELEQYETIVETVTDGIIVVDADAVIRSVNDAVVEMTGYSREALINAPASLIRPDDLDETMNGIQASLDAGAGTEVVETEIQPATGEPFLSTINFARITLDDGTSGRVGVIRDISDQIERERELEESEQRYRTLIEHFPNGAVALVNDELEYITIGGTPIQEVGVRIDELERSPLTEVLPPDFVDALLPRYRAALHGESSKFEDRFGGRQYQFTIVPVRDESGAVFGALGMSQDITDRYEYEQALESRVRQLEAITNLGQQALKNRDIDALMAKAAELVAETLDNDYCKVLDLDVEAEEFLLRQGVGWRDGIVGKARISATDHDSQAAYTLAAEHPIVVEDLASETRFTGPDLLTSHAVRSGINTIIGPVEEPWGVIGTYDTASKDFSAYDVQFMQAIANILTSAINRHNDEQELANQRAHLSVLNNLNGVVREITDAVIEQPSREEIEQVVCDQLVLSDSYTFAWIAEVSQRTGEILTRAEAGIDGVSEDIEWLMTPDKAVNQDPIREAFRTGTMRVSQDVWEESNRHHDREFGGQSLAAIPIVHEATLYGVLNVCAERPDAFTTDEREVIGQLGEVIGHTIAAIERKRALLSDEAIELEFRLQNVFEMIGVPVVIDGQAVLERTVPVGDGVFLEYGSATGDAIAAVEAMVESDAVPHWESVNVLETDGDVTRFELTMVDPPVLSSVPVDSGYIVDARLGGDDYYLRVHLAPSADVRRVVEAVTDSYPGIQMGAQRQVAREQTSTAHLKGALIEELTDRQRAALEAGYYAGYFDWPRGSSGEDVATSLNIGSSTFHQHLRKAEKTLLDLVFTGT